MNIGKLEPLQNDSSKQAPPITEGFSEIQIDIHLTREITWQYDTRELRRHHEWPPFVMTINKSGWILPHPSAVLHVITSTGICGWQKLYPIVHLWSEVRYHPTQRSLKLLILWDPIISYASVHNQSCSPVPDDRSSIDTGGGYHIRSSKYENRPLSPFPSDILQFTLVALPGLT
jgi:hypothetical protein